MTITPKEVEMVVRYVQRKMKYPGNHYYYSDVEDVGQWIREALLRGGKK